nr:hypothetical protein [Tanacetum cinerariifolium]
MQTQTSKALHNAIMEAGGKDRPPMLALGNYVQWKSRIKRYIDTKPNYELIHYRLQNPPYEYRWTDKVVPVAEAEAVQIILIGIDNDIYSTVDACPNACEMWKAIEMKPKRAKDAAYYKEKMLLCKQEEARVQLNAEQADWRDDTDDESDDQELEAHYMYMAHVQVVTPNTTDNSGPIFDAEPLQKVQNNDDNYNEFDADQEYPEQPASVNEPYDDMCFDRDQDDQDDTDELAQERDLLASLIDKLKCEIDDNKNLLDLKKEQSAHQETITIMSQQKEAQIKFYRTHEDKDIDEVITLENKVKVLDNILYKTVQSVQTINMLNQNCKMSFVKPEFLKKAQRANPRLLNAKTSNVNFVYVTCGKYLLNDNHDMCVLYYLNDMNSRTKMPMAVPISTREPKRSMNQSVATPLRRTVALESSNQKPRHITRKLYEHVSKTCSWWYPKLTPPGYKWKPKSQTGNVNPNVSMPLGNASRFANILEPKTPRFSTVSNTSLSSNYFVARRDNPIHRTVKFGNDQIAPTLGYGDLVQGTVTIKRVYYVEGLNHNLFSVGSHGIDLYSITLQDTSSPNSICLMDKATSSQAWLWHRRLSHLNFDTINLLSKNDIVIDYPKLQKTVTTSTHDLCGPMRVESINGKKYVLVIVDDYSRYTWIHFLRSKDETLEVLIDFLRLVQRRLHAQVRTVRTDKGTKFLNKTLHAYFVTEGIEHQTFVARTPKQNGVFERWNHTLVEATRTMLSTAKVPLYFWDEAIATSCFTQNCSLVIPQHEKTPYHIINGWKLSVKFVHNFGSLCYIIKDGGNLDKMKEKGDACIFVGYSTKSRAYKITSVLKHDSLSPGPQCQENVPQAAATVTMSNELDFLISLMFDELLNGSTQVVSKSSAVTTADAPNQCQQQHITLSTTTIVAADTTPLNTQTTPEPICQDPTQALTVTSSENINQAKMITENAQVEDEEFINIFCTPVQERGEPSSYHPLEKVIGNPSQSIRTRRQLEKDGETFMFALTVSRTEPKNIKEAMDDSAWIDLMQEELHQCNTSIFTI